MTKFNHTTAWFGSEHPAKDRPCSDCGAKVGEACVETVGFAGTAPGPGRRPLLGMHKARVQGET